MWWFDLCAGRCLNVCKYVDVNDCGFMKLCAGRRFKICECVSVNDCGCVNLCAGKCLNIYINLYV